MLLSIILPARNEESLIRKTLKDITDFLDKNKFDYEILVVINGTTDKTLEIVKKESLNNKKIKVLESEPGYGKALIKGLQSAKGKYLVVFNVDFYDLRMIDLVKVDLCGKDMVIGSKMAPWSFDKRPLTRRIISFFFNQYLKIFYGFRGSDTHGIKIIRSKVVDKILPKCRTDSGIFDTEFVLRVQYEGFSFSDFPVTVEEKRPPRFTKRLLKTPMDILELSRALRASTNKEKELFYNDFSTRWRDLMKKGVGKKETDKRLKIIFDKLLSGISIKGKKFLDVGCGLGFFSREALKRGAIVVGCDVGPNLVNYCRKKIPEAKFVVSSASNLSFQNNFFDIVLFTEVLEHVDDQFKSLDEVFRVVKKGGYVVLTTPNKLYKPFFDFLSFVRIRPYHGNEKWFYIWNLREILSHYGKIEKEFYFNFLIPFDFFDRFYNNHLLRNLMINQSFVVKKIK